jgi:formylglycine-generating enzyme required for sulfatase activity
VTGPARVFLSYSHADEAWKDRLAAQLGALERAGRLCVWDDRRIGAGADWLPQIEAELAGCAVALLLVSPNFLASPFIVETEVPHLLQRRAQDGLRVIPVFVRPCVWRRIDWLNALQGRPIDGRALNGMTEHDADAALTALVLEIDDLLRAGTRDSRLLGQVRSTVGDDQQDQIAALIPEIDARADQAPDAACPYRGLHAFSKDDSALFYGRDEATERLVKAVSDHPLVAVIGASGSGKSSVVQAGLIPRLKAQGGWAFGILRPGADPWRSLAACLSDLLGDTYATDLERLRAIAALATDLAQAQPGQGAPRPLVRLDDVVHRLIEKDPASRRLLLVVDQWEELYTLGSNAAGPLADGLIAATQTAPLTVVLTLRADFMGQALAHRPLVDRLDAGKVLLGPMTRDELEQAIVGPATRAGLDFEPGLVASILNDVDLEPGQLPLLEFCLTPLCARRRDGRMLHAAYEAIGRVPGAIIQHADAVIDALPASHQERARDLFLHLVQLGEGTDDTRRRALIRDLGEAARPLITELANAEARLVVTGQDMGSGDDTIEVAHEALIRTWPRLRGWLDQDRDDLRLRREIERVAGAWEAHGQAGAYRWSDARVMETAPAVQRIVPRFPLAAREQAFLGPLGEDQLLALLQDPATVHADRAMIGDRLNLLPGGDPRPGVGLRDGVPDIEWCAIPGGEVEIAIEAAGAWARLRRFGRRGAHLHVAPFALAKYPVTVAQWRAFLVDPQGYDALIRSRFNADPGRQPGGDNHPAVNLTWVEAIAYCQWLSARLGRAVRLPTEWEWQQAATSGQPDRQYPWGRDWVDGAANTIESDLGRLTAVGLYPAGASDQGAMDLAGNSWDWCLNQYDRVADIKEGGDASRVVRGGSWLRNQSDARAAFRDHFHPRYRYGFIGFRLVCASPIL